VQKSFKELNNQKAICNYSGNITKMKNTQKGKQPASSAMSASRKGVAVTRFKKRKGLAMKGGKIIVPSCILSLHPETASIIDRRWCVWPLHPKIYACCQWEVLCRVGCQHLPLVCMAS